VKFDLRFSFVIPKVSVDEFSMEETSESFNCH
jgi:hypothetical protein